MRNLQTKSFMFGSESALVTYDDDTHEALTWETKDHHGKFIDGVKLNCIYSFRTTISERHIFKYDMNGCIIGYNIDETCEWIYRKYVEEGIIEDGDWAYVNILSTEPIEPKLLDELSTALRVRLAKRYGGELRVAVDNTGILDSPANAVVFYADDDNYIVADRKEVMPDSGVFSGGIFGTEHVNNRVHGTIEGDMAELSRVLQRIRRNDTIEQIDFSLNSRGLVVTTTGESGSIVRTLEVYGEKFKLGNK